MMLGRRSAAGFVCRNCTRRLVQGTRQAARQLGQEAERAGAGTSSSAAAHSSGYAGPRQQRFFASAAETLTPDPDDIYDVVCVGGGPAGLSLLTALRSNPTTSHLRVALIEAQDLNKLRQWQPKEDTFSNRCSSLTPTSARFLDKIGAWSELRRERVQAYQAMQVWDGVSGTQIDFDWPPGTTLDPSTGGNIAYMVENLNLTAALLRRLDSLGGVTYLNEKVDRIGYGSEGDGERGLDLSGWPAVFLGGEQQRKPILARLLVGADGANSPVRSFADIAARGWDYGRFGVVATLQLEPGGSLSGDAFRTAYQRFLPSGPLAILPLPGDRATMVWSTTPERAARLRSLDPEALTAMVNGGLRLRPADLTYLHGESVAKEDVIDEVTWRLSVTASSSSSSSSVDNLPRIVGVQPGSVAAFPLRLRHADSYIADRVALVGDAAHTVHPLAGQGLNAGQGDVAALAHTIADAVDHGQDLGVRPSLEPYPAARYAANHVMLGVCDKLHKLYATDVAPVVAARSLGLWAVDALRPLKTFLMKEAAGK